MITCTEAETSKELAQPLKGDVAKELTDEFRFAAAVASFGMLLKGSPHSANFNYAFVRELADGARGQDPFGYRAEFVDLVSRAEALESVRGKAAE